MEKIVIVVGDRKNPQAHHIKMEGKITIGRALSCDVILSDDYCEPMQLIFNLIQQEGETPRRTVEVLNSINPVMRNGEPITAGIYNFVSGDQWSFGKTRLLAFNENHAAEPTEKLALKEYHGKNGMKIVIFLAALSSLIAYILLTTWLKNYTVIDDMRKIAANTFSDNRIMLVFIWAISWGIIGRVVTGRYQFNIHFVASCIYIVLDGVFRSALYEYPSYAFNINGSMNVFLNHLITDLCFYVFIYITLSYALNIRKLVLASLVATALISAYMYFEDIRNTRPLEPHFNQSVKPPFAIMVKPETVESFRATMDKVFVEASED